MDEQGRGMGRGKGQGRGMNCRGTGMGRGQGLGPDQQTAGQELSPVSRNQPPIEAEGVEPTAGMGQGRGLGRNRGMRCGASRGKC